VIPRVLFRAQFPGLLRGSALVATINAIMLSLGAAKLKSLLNAIGPHSDAAPALLLVVAGLVSAFMARPGEHVLASRILVGPRAAVLLSGFLSYAAAISIVVGTDVVHELPGLQWTWWILASLSWLSVVVLGLAAALARNQKTA